MDIESIIYDKLYSLGASDIGFSDVNGFLPENIKKLHYAITVCIRLSNYIVNEIDDKPSFTYFHHYRTINTLIDQITLRCVLLLQEEGYNAFAVPASQTVNNIGKEHYGIFQHKTAASLSGLGWIGKNAMFVNNKYGPRVRLGTVLTDYKFSSIGKRIENKCGNCNLCANICPAKAIKGVLWDENCSREDLFDANLCVTYMKTSFKDIGRGSVCGICMKICPYGISHKGVF